jgi:hypothetical protein
MLGVLQCVCPDNCQCDGLMPKEPIKEWYSDRRWSEVKMSFPFLEGDDAILCQITSMNISDNYTYSIQNFKR